MSDVVVTVPKGLWSEWIVEGDAAGEPATGNLYFFTIPYPAPDIQPGERVYVVAHGRLRGYAPLVKVDRIYGSLALFREAGAEAITIAEPIRGFRGWRYRWWNRSDEVPFPAWRTAGVGQTVSVEQLSLVAMPGMSRPANRREGK